MSALVFDHEFDAFVVFALPGGVGVGGVFEFDFVGDDEAGVDHLFQD